MQTVLIRLKIARSSREIRMTWLTVWYAWRPVPIPTSNALVVRSADREGPLARAAEEIGTPTFVNVYHQFETSRCLTVLKCAAAPSTCSRYLVFRSGGPISSRRPSGYRGANGNTSRLLGCVVHTQASFSSRTGASDNLRHCSQKSRWLGRLWGKPMRSKRRPRPPGRPAQSVPWAPLPRKFQPLLPQMEPSRY